MLNSRHLLQGPSSANRRPGATPGEAGHESHRCPEPVPGAHLRGGGSRVAAAGAAAVRMGPSLGGCGWRRNGWETHLSEPRAAASLLANWTGPWGEDPQGREGKPGPRGGPPQLFSPSSCRSSFLLFGSATQGGGRVTCPCLRGKGAAQLLALCSTTPPPRPTHVHKHTHTHLIFGWPCPLLELLPARIWVSSAWGYGQRA